jgi:hypothetical protein
VINPYTLPLSAYPCKYLEGDGMSLRIYQIREFKKRAGGKSSSEAQMKKALQDIFRLVEG